MHPTLSDVHPDGAVADIAVRGAGRIEPAVVVPARDLRVRIVTSHVEEERKVYNLLWWRTIQVSIIVTLACLLLAYPVSYLLATLPMRISNLLMICVLMPFWTSPDGARATQANSAMERSIRRSDASGQRMASPLPLPLPFPSRCARPSLRRAR